MRVLDYRHDALGIHLLPRFPAPLQHFQLLSRQGVTHFHKHAFRFRSALAACLGFCTAPRLEVWGTKQLREIQLIGYPALPCEWFAHVPCRTHEKLCGGSGAGPRDPLDTAEIPCDPRVPLH